MAKERLEAAVIGTGYVGLVTGACLAASGRRVRCHDIDVGRIEALRAGEVPIYEPGLDEVVSSAVQAGRLDFTDRVEDIGSAAAVLLAVGTPQGDDGAADLSHLFAAADSVAEHAASGAAVAVRSTVPPGSGQALRDRFIAADRSDLDVVNVPEFLAEGTAVKDFQEPDRLVFGGPRDAARRVAGLWRDIHPEAPRIFTDNATAELAKYAANTFLAARVSLINEMANLCDAFGADVRTLAQVVGADDRIGPKFLRPGIGYGGSCFPKDVQAILHVGRSARVPLPVAEAAEATNAAQWRRVAMRVEEVHGDLAGKRVAIWGIAFKPGTDDTRSAPGLRLARHLVDAGATVAMADPVARLPADLADAGVTQAGDALSAVDGAHSLVHVTEWPQFRRVQAKQLAQRLAGHTVIDARNALDWDALTDAGLTVVGIGARPAEVVAA